MKVFSPIVTQIRLLASEMLIRWAMEIAPASHPDSVAIYEAAAHVAHRKIK